MACSHSNALNFILIGDSDMAKWPSSQLPSLANLPTLKHHNFKQVISNFAKNGALLSNVPSQVEKAIKELNITVDNAPSNSSRKHHSNVFFIACAGENDLSQGFSVDAVMQSFNSLIDTIFSYSTCNNKPHLIFFGPKIEPWLNASDKDDKNSEEMRKAYFQLSQRLKLCCHEFNTNVTVDHNHLQKHGFGNNHHCHSDGKNVTFINSLTLFCDGDEDDGGESYIDNGIGAILSGKVKANEKYFDTDGLHLNEEGYGIWKQELDILTSQILCTERCLDSLDMSRGKNIILD